MLPDYYPGSAAIFARCIQSCTPLHTLSQLQSGTLNGITSLKLSEGLTGFPREILDLADTLEVLDLSGNQLTSLPPDFGRLHKLRILFCSHNPFTELPAVLGQCPALEMIGFKACHIEYIPAAALGPGLRWLTLTDNRITRLPAAIGLCTRLEKLLLAGNRLTELPPELEKCTHLSLLRIAANRLPSLPSWLLSMPRLAWLAFSGNGFSSFSHRQLLPAIPWQSVTLHEVLGQGASGIIHRATIVHTAGAKEVAVKLFKGAVTSDGLPGDELNAFIAAGSHPALIGLMGSIGEHPDGRNGLVMELIPARCHNLGLPPDFNTCTRDTFPPGASVSWPQLLNIAVSVASVAAQLHSRGIMHGDLYAHNILADDDGNALLTDFGAASFYDRSHTVTAAAMERIEVAAFGYLLNDMLGICNWDDTRHIAILQQMSADCLRPQVSLRPSFQELTDRLSVLVSHCVL